MYASPWAAPCTDGHRSRRYTSTAAIRCTIHTPRFRRKRNRRPKKRPPFLRRVVKYFEGSTTDRTFEKEDRLHLRRGPSHSKNTSLGIGLLAAGLYRIDRTDSVTAPSDISIFANVSISGFYALGVTGNNIFARNSKRIDYTVMFASAPRDMWGIGYHDGRYNEEGSYNEKRYLVKGATARVLPNTYVGGILSFEHTQGKKFDARSEGYLQVRAENALHCHRHRSHPRVRLARLHPQPVPGHLRQPEESFLRQGAWQLRQVAVAHDLHGRLVPAGGKGD